MSPIPWSCLADVTEYHRFPTSEVRGIFTVLKALGACPPRPGTSRNPIPHVFCLGGCICLNTVPSVISRACNGSGVLLDSLLHILLPDSSPYKDHRSYIKHREDLDNSRESQLSLILPATLIPLLSYVTPLFNSITHRL